MEKFAFKNLEIYKHSIIFPQEPITNYFSGFYFGNW